MALAVGCGGPMGTTGLALTDPGTTTTADTVHLFDGMATA